MRLRGRSGDRPGTRLRDQNKQTGAWFPSRAQRLYRIFPTAPGTQKRYSRCGPALRTGDRSSRERRVAARHDVSSSPPPSRARARTHTHSSARRTRTHTAAHRRARARSAAQPLVDRPVAAMCRVGGSPRFFLAVSVRPDRPWRATSSPRRSAQRRARARQNVRENRMARARTLARACVRRRTPCQRARRIRGAESRVKPAGLPKLGGPARIGGSCGAARRDSPRENSAGNQMWRTVPREACGETFRVQTTACTHGDGGAATRRDAARRGAVVVAMP